MTDEQYWALIELAKTQLLLTERESHWRLYIEGITDLAYAIGDFETMSRLDTRLSLMWEQKRLEGMI